MQTKQFLEYHGIARNPFAEEDAQTDLVFKNHCIERTYHPSWDKIFGDPREPSTAIVFGEKGAGKTAMRLQIVRHLDEHNAKNPDARAFVIEYDDFNPFLDRFRQRLRGKGRAERVLSQWRLWDHMDAILALGVTQLVDRLLGRGPSGPDRDLEKRLASLDRLRARDLLLLAALYDQSLGESPRKRWHRLRRKARYNALAALWPALLGIVGTTTIAALIIWQQRWDWLSTGWPYLFAIACWGPWCYLVAKWTWKAAAVRRRQRALAHELNPLRDMLMSFPGDQLSGQPLPTIDRTDDRYELLLKFQDVLRALGYPSVVVLVDRVDEPHLINGSADLMKAFLWPMLDNKFLKHHGLGLKLLLPIELARFIDREERDFYQRARLDKQNLIPSLAWSGEALYDVANDRIQACAANGRTANLRDFFDSSVSDARLLESFRSLRAPRHLFRFLYRLLMSHSSAHSDKQPVWQINASTFEKELALYQRDQDAFDRGVGAG